MGSLFLYTMRILLLFTLCLCVSGCTEKLPSNYFALSDNLAYVGRKIEKEVVLDSNFVFGEEKFLHQFNGENYSILVGNTTGAFSIDTVVGKSIKNVYYGKGKRSLHFYKHRDLFVHDCFLNANSTESFYLLRIVSLDSNLVSGSVKNNFFKNQTVSIDR